MVLLYLSAFLCHIVTLSCMSSAERHLVCSSESVSLWYSYDVFSTTRMGCHALLYYEGQLWFDHVQPEVSCEHLKICDIIKGETLHDTVPVYLRTFYPPEGEYQVYAYVTLVDDLENIQTVYFSITGQVKYRDVMNKSFQ